MKTQKVRIKASVNMPENGKPKNKHRDLLQPADYNYGLQKEGDYNSKLANALVIVCFISMHI